MPRVEKIGKDKYQYKCACGRTVIFETDTPPKRVYKCFECQLTEEEVNHGRTHKAAQKN